MTIVSMISHLKLRRTGRRTNTHRHELASTKLAKSDKKSLRRRGLTTFNYPFRSHLFSIFDVSDHISTGSQHLFVCIYLRHLYGCSFKHPLTRCCSAAVEWVMWERGVYRKCGRMVNSSRYPYSMENVSWMMKHRWSWSPIPVSKLCAEYVAGCHLLQRIFIAPNQHVSLREIKRQRGRGTEGSCC